MNKRHAQQDLQRPLEEVVSEAFAKYAKYIIQDRALPDLRDGLKPVQRRIIYAAHLNKLTHKNPHKKSATLVGDVMGSFHPHGDSSIYDAIVRMSQPWKSNLSLLEMHGNVGSIDGDPAAAYRYTEVRLAAVSEWLLKNLEKQTVPFVNNFDDTQKEPTVLPAQFFNLLVNGASGISAGYATNIPLFNPREVCYLLVKLIDQPNLKIEEIQKILPAPDFPTGGTIEVSEGLYEAYKTGKGKFFLFANYKIVETKDVHQIIFIDVPFETNKANIVRRIDDLIVNNKIPGALEVRDESGRDGINIVIDVKKHADPNLIIQYLYKNTDLRISFNINMVVIDQRKPKQLNLRELLQGFLTHFKNVVTSGFIYDHKQLVQRLSIIDGLLKALKIIDEIIRVIRRSNDKQSIIEKLTTNYGFTNDQAEAIVSLRLYRLSNTDQNELLDEKKTINEQIARLDLLLSNEREFKKYLKSQVLTFAEEFGYDRKTKISEAIIDLDFDQEALVVDKKLCYSWIDSNQIKILDHKSYQLSDLKNNRVKKGETYRTFGTVNNKDQLLLITNLGNLALIPVYKLELKKINMLAQPLNKLVLLEPHEKIIAIHPLAYNQTWTEETVLFFTQQGMGKKVLISEIIKLKSERIFSAIKLKPDDKLVKTILVSQPKGSVVFLSMDGYANHVLISEINASSRNSMGQKAMRFKPNDQACDLLLVPSNPDSQLVLWFNNGLIKTAFNQNFELSKWGLVGKKLGTKKTMKLSGAWFATKNDHLWVWKNQETVDLVPVSGLKNEVTTTHPYLDVYLETYLANKLQFPPHPKDQPIAKLF